MFQQNQVLRTRNGERLAAILADGCWQHRMQIVRGVCEEFGFVDARGVLQVATCAKALSKLEARGRVVLPEPANRYAAGAGPCKNEERVPEPVALPETLHGVRGLKVKMVETDAQRRVWNTLLHYEHPRGTTTFVGAQARYLVCSAHGYLGAVGFSAAALRLACREQWMAWSDVQRKAHLHRVVCMSRFLVRGECQHLASHVLGKVLQRVADDFRDRYDYRPWIVETYVDPKWEGTCFRASNFTLIGHTAGGKRHKDADREETSKALYVYELDKHWRRHLGVPEVELRPMREPHEGIDSAQWAEAEFGAAPLGDSRLSTRLVKSASLLSDVVGHSITAHTGADRAAVKGHYRLLESKRDKTVTPANILAPHRARTIERMRSQKVVLCIQDTTKLRYSTRPACTDLQVIGQNQTSAKTRGMPLHATLAVTEDGLPLGVLRCSYRDLEGGTHRPRTQQWMDGFEDICEASKEVSRKIRVLCVADREADSFALYDAQRKHDRVGVVVRARHDRKLLDGDKMFATMRSGRSAGGAQIEIQRVTAREKSSGKQARKGRSHRIANAEVRYKRLRLPDPKGKAEPVEVYGVHVREAAAPRDESPVEWMLLTSMPVESVADAKRVLGMYVKRWRVEDFFRILKSGCKVERLGLRTSMRLEHAVTIYCVIAWRVMTMVLLGREVPELDADVFFTDMELRFLTGYTKKVRLPEPKTLGEAMLAVSVLGGYQNRSLDGPAGYQIMWRGLERLHLTTLGFEVGYAQWHDSS